MRRREFITLVGGAVGWTVAVVAAQDAAVRVIGWLSVRSENTDTETNILAAFRDGLRQTGYVEGKNLTMEFRFGEGDYDRLPALAADLVSKGVSVIVTSGSSAIVKVAQASTSTIPIVFATASDPVRDGLVKSINKPGGNSTGTYLLNNQIAPKRLEILRELLPTINTVGFLINPQSFSSEGQLHQFDAAARSMDLGVNAVKASTATEIEAAFAELSKRRTTALVMGADPLFQVHQALVVTLADRYKIPTIYEWPEFVRAGGLIAYAVDRVEVWRQIGVYVTRILNGAKPAELPIIQPTKFELVVNLKTGKALGLSISETFLQRADEVIE